MTTNSEPTEEQCRWLKITSRLPDELLQQYLFTLDEKTAAREINKWKRVRRPAERQRLAKQVEARVAETN